MLTGLFSVFSKAKSPRQGRTQNAGNAQKWDYSHSSELARICRRVDLTASAGDFRKPNWKLLKDELRKANASFGLDVPGAEPNEQTAPFGDIVVKDPAREDHEWDQRLRLEVDAEFEATGVQIAVASFNNPDVSQICAYFGNGVFAPNGHDDVVVADLEFTWHQPDAETDDVPAHLVVRPILSENSAGPAAAWYAGQNGIAIEFGSGAAPCRLELPNDPSLPACIGNLANCVLFIGRTRRYHPPGVSLMPVPEYHKSMGQIHAGPNNIGALADSTRWLRLDLSVGPGVTTDAQGSDTAAESGSNRVSLWVRHRPRTGLAHYVRTPSPEKPIIAIKGIAIPRIPYVRKFNSKAPGKWFLRCDGHGKLRGTEITETGTTTVADILHRCAVYRHTNGIWLSVDFEADGRRRLPITEYRAMVEAPFPGELVPLASDIETANRLRRVYRSLYEDNEWSVIRTENDEDLAYLELDEPYGHLDTNPTDQTHIVDADGTIPVLGLDWLNRAAQVEVGDETMGVASFWGRTYECDIDVHSEAIWVRLKNTVTNITQEYDIPLNNHGMLGPLYVEYRTPGYTER